MLGARNPFREFARYRERYPLLPALKTREEYQARKIELVTGIGRAESLRDFGGLWGVEGVYLLSGARALGARYAEMVDVASPGEQFLRAADQLSRETGACVTLTRGDFRNAALHEPLKPMEVSLLYDVLLHQENAVQVIGNVVSRTTGWVCVAQPVLKEEVFPLPCGCVNLLFYPPELKDALRCAYWPPEPPAQRFTTRYWTWGQTVSYLTSVFHGCGWERRHLEAHDMPPHWAYALMRFAPREPSATPPTGERAEAAASRPSGRATFADLPQGSPGFAEVEACVRAGIARGYGEGLFEPEGIVTLTDVAVFLARAMAGGDEQVPEVTHAATFADVPSFHWAWRHVEYLHAKGLLGREPDGTCRAVRVVEQDELATLVGAAARAAGHGPVAGFDAGLRAGAASTRREVAVCIARAFGLVSE